MAGKKFDFDHMGIGHLLRMERLTVPLNQRSYAWEDNHVVDLFQDLSSAIRDDESDYFLGTIVLTAGDKVPEVTDGQQRLATTTILLAAIRDYFNATGKTERASQIDNDYLSRLHEETDDRIQRLQLNVEDNEFFRRFIVDAKHDRRSIKTDTLRSSNLRILTAARLAEQHVHAVVEQYKPVPEKEKTLLKWVSYLDAKATVVVVYAPEDVDAFRMFQTLNDRGLRASQADLLKNHFFRKAPARQEEVQAKWSSMTGAIETIGDDDLIVTYIRHFWITKYGPTRERDLAASIYGEITSQNKTVEFLTELEDASGDYIALFNPEHPKWNVYKNVCRQYVETILKHLQIEQIRPLLFAVSRYFSAEEAQKALKLFVSWSVRFLIVGGRGGMLDRQYSLRAQDIGTGRITTAKQLMEEMKEYVPSDPEFEDRFKTARVSQAFLARYYLRALDLTLKGELEPEVLANDDKEILNLEHIMPRTPSAEWSVDEETALACQKRLGNMVLLKASRNVMLGNSPFEEKKREYVGSAIAITKQVAEYGQWSMAEINDRQAKLARIAVRTWPVSVS